ncbi:MAG: sugar transferase [bacterium]
MIKEHESLLRGAHMVLDAVLLGLVFGWVYAAQNLVRVELLAPDVPALLAFEAYRWVMLTATVTWVIVLHVTGGYYSYRSASFGSLVGMQLRTGMAVLGILGFTLFALKDPTISRSLILTFVGVGVVALSVERVVVKRLLELIRSRHYNQRYVLVVGAGAQAQELVASIEGNPGRGYQCVGCLAPDVADAAERGLETLGSLDDLEAVLKSRPVDEVAFLLNDLGTARLTEWLPMCAREGVKARLFFLPPPLDSMDNYLETLNGIPSISFGIPPSRYWQLLVKRAIDVVVASVALVVTSPLALLAAAAIRLTSPGPVFFRQVRYGLNKRRFTLLKFRTMVVDAEHRRGELEALNEMDGPVFKIRNDPRVTKVGRVLRATSVDELPQLVNVLLGHMSLVGPRPPIPSEVDAYQPWQRRRLSMKPGITGPWQVSGRNQVDFERWMHMDMEYVDNWSLLKDLEILLKTVPAIVRGTGAW